MSIVTRRRWTLLLAAVCTVGVQTALGQKVWDGTTDITWYTGDAAQAYNIMTAEQLAGLALLVNNGNSFAGKTITLGADIFLNDTMGSTSENFNTDGKKPWTPIGIYATNSGAKPFSGEFDGIAGIRNRRIYGLYIPDGTIGQGLFGYTSSSIKNLDVLVGSVTGTQYVGGVAGYGASFTNVNSDIAVSGNSYVGGLAGMATGNINKAAVRGTVIANDNYVGGLVGYTGGNITSSNHTGGNVSGTNYVGGLVGYTGANITSSNHTDGTVSGTDYVGGLVGYSKSIAITGVSSDTGYTTFSKGNVSGRNYVGGLVGYDSTTTTEIVNVYSVGDVSGENSIGGLIGYSQGYRQGYSKDIKNAYSQGKVQGDGIYVGGLVGYTRANITSSNHTGGNVSGTNYVGGLVGCTGTGANITSSNHTGGTVSGTDYVGGLVGYSQSRAITGVNSDTGYTTFSKGNVSGRNFVGGLVGHAQYYTIYKMDSTIVNVYSVGDVSGKSNIGGLIGYSQGYSQSSRNDIQNAYSQGKVEGDSVYVGGLVGYMVYGSIISSNHTGGAVSGTDYVGGLVGYSQLSAITGVNSDTGYTTFSKGNVSGRNFVGGLVGHARYDSTTTTTTTTTDSIVNVYSIGDVSGKSNIGGLIGYSNGFGHRRYLNSNGYYRDTLFCVDIKNAYSQGKIQGDSVYVGGLVGYMVYGSIISSNHTGGAVSGTDYVGGLVGYSQSRAITGVRTNTGYTTFSKGNVSGRNFVGGLVGHARYDSTTTTDSIVNVYSIGDVSGKSNIGGLIGYSQGYSQSSRKDIRNAYSQGKVEGDSVYVGGLVGYVRYGGITSSNHTDGTVSGTNYIGGLIGYVSGGGITNSHSIDSVKGIYQVGGLVGSFDVSNSYSSYIDSCYSHSNVIGDDNIGGLVGSLKGTIQNSSASGNVTGDVNNSSSGNDNLGGLVGYAYSGRIYMSYALGNVIGTTKVGGLAGRADNIGIINAYSRGNVTAEVYDGDIGSVYAGGLVGYAGGTCGFSAAYSGGAVTAAAYAGGFVGYSDGTLELTHCSYDNTKNNQTQGVGYGEVNLDGNTTAEMMSAATFPNWDWNTIWFIDEGNDYPDFKWTHHITYTVTFNANGGTVTQKTGTTGIYRTLKSLPVPERSDYTFNGWFTAAAGGTAVTNSTVFMADTTIYAQWILTLSIVSRDRNAPLLPTNPDGKQFAEGLYGNVSGEFTAGPNPAAKSDGKISFFRQGGQLKNATLSIYDASGNLVKKISISDNALNNQAKRAVGSWDLKDSKGREVSAGTYVIKGTVKMKDGKKEKVSAVLGVR